MMRSFIYHRNNVVIKWVSQLSTTEQIAFPKLDFIFKCVKMSMFISGVSPNFVYNFRIITNLSPCKPFFKYWVASQIAW